MAGRWRDPAAFRADPTVAPALRPSRRQSIALLVVILLAAGAAMAASWLIQPDRARSFALFHGSLFLADSVAPVAIDLASGKPTVRLIDADHQVGARQSGDLGVVPVDNGTLLLNRATGEFNMVDNTGFVIKNSGGVSLARRAGSTGSVGIASTDGFAYILQTGPTGTSVYLVGPTTVQTAVSAGAQVKPRAFRSMPEPSSTEPGASASAGGQLWLLAGSGTQRTVRQLSLPAGSNTGATLTPTDRGTVNGVAAIGTATDGKGGSAVGVASADRIQVFGKSGDPSTVHFPAIAGADSILPASNAAGRLSYLVHGRQGWSVVSVDADGSGLRGPALLTGVTPGAKLVTPAASGNDLYTMDAEGGQLVRIGPNDVAGPVEGAESYPLTKQDGRVIEPSGFADAYVIARGSRVILNSPDHLEALVLFTDGSHAPLTIEKSSAVSVSASEGAEALTRSRIALGSQTPKPGKGSKQKVVAAINNKIDCKTTNQKPHIPTIAAQVPGSRSAQLSWTYPLVDPQDCEPTTYVVKVTLLSNAAPSPPASLTVQGQRQVNLTGLFPSTRYEISVTAYLNGKGTESEPAQIRTGPEGPAPAHDLRVTTASDGNWALSWKSCGSVESGCVPSSSWKVIPEFCDGRGLSQPPDPVTVSADPTAERQPPALIRGGDALLGRGMSFRVEGLGLQGTVGEPSDSTPCSYSWSHPDPAALQLNATRPPQTTLGGSSATTVSVDLGANPVRDVGGIGAQITLKLTGPNYSRSTRLTYNGRNSHPKTVFAGVRAGLTYTASAVISPPQHAASSVTLGPQGVTTNAAWPPGMGLSAKCPPATVVSCDLAVQVTGLSSAQAQGERFDLDSDASKVQCGNLSQGLSQNDFDPAKTPITHNLNQLDGYFGTCTVTVVLVESGSNAAPLVFGGVPSQGLTTQVDLGKPTTVDLRASDFDVSWSSQGGASAQIHYVKGKGNLDLLTKNWMETIKAPNGAGCEDPAGQDTPGHNDAFVHVDAQCVNKFGGSTNDWTVTLTYRNSTDGSLGSTVAIPLSGPAPGYQPCRPGVFRATWGDHKADGITVDATGNQFDGCSDWTYEVRDKDDAVCVAAAQAPSTHPTVTIDLDSCGSTPSDGWTVVITWVDTAGDPQRNNPATPVTGPPPES